MNASFWRPVAVSGLVITGRAQTLKGRVCEAEPLWFAAVICADQLPTVVGVPEIAPVLPLIARPGGSPVAL